MNVLKVQLVVPRHALMFLVATSVRVNLAIISQVIYLAVLMSMNVLKIYTVALRLAQTLWGVIIAPVILGIGWQVMKRCVMVNINNHLFSSCFPQTI